MINEITFTLKNLKKNTKRFSMYDIDENGYYIFSIVSLFSNLIDLRLEYCFIPYRGFAKLGESLSSLKNIKLTKIVFIKLSNDIISINDFVFPPELTSLVIDNCEEIIRDDISYPAGQYMHEYSGEETVGSFSLPNISIPSLKNIYADSMWVENCGLKNFLLLNPNLESVYIDFLYLNMIENLKSLKSLEIRNLYTFDDYSQLHIFKSIKKIRINYISTENYETATKLFLCCPNLEYLQFTIPHHINLTAVNGNIIESIIRNLHQLKTLHLDIGANANNNFDITKLSNIETLILETQGSIILNLDFANCTNLKRVVFDSNDVKIRTKEFIDKFLGYKNWNFRFDLLTITGFKNIN